MLSRFACCPSHQKCHHSFQDTAFPMSPFASTILAFEPNPHSFAVLQTNARLNPEMGLIPYNVGVGSDGTADFFFGGASAATFFLAATVAAAL